jgi:hypothetical protein
MEFMRWLMEGEGFASFGLDKPIVRGMLQAKARLKGIKATPLEIAFHKLKSKADTAPQRASRGEVCSFLISTMMELEVESIEEVRNIRQECARVLGNT